MEKYRQIETKIKNEIEKGTYKSGDKLPPEMELCQQFQVSRITVRKALQDLTNQGIIIRKVGDGTYVNDSKYVNHSGMARSFSEDMIQNGKVPGSELIEFRICKGKNDLFIAKKLKISTKDLYYMITRIRTGDSIPIALSYTFIPYELMPNFDVDKIVNGSLYDYITEKYELDLDRGAIGKTIAAIMPTRTQKKYLKIADEPLLKITHSTQLKNKKIFEYTETYYVGSRFIYTYDEDNY